MESQLIGRLFLALKCIVTQTLSGPGEGMGKGLSNLIQVGPAFGREGGFRQRTSSGPSQPALCVWGACLLEGGRQEDTETRSGCAAGTAETLDS